MLGRLFSTKGNEPIPTMSPCPTVAPYALQPSSSASTASSPTTPKFEPTRTEDFCDTYTRALLYGSPDPLSSTALDNSAFRILVIQDGAMRSKHVLYDSAISTHQPQSLQSSPLQSYGTNTKIDNSRYHNLMELSDYIFGCGLPVADTSISTKLHTLASLPKLPSSVLITRLFSLNPKFSSNEMVDPLDDEWNPQSSLPLPHPSSSKDLIRFGIGFVLPLGNQDLESAITNNWEAYINLMASFQHLIISKLKLQCTINPGNCIAINNCKRSSTQKRLSFPNYILQNDLEIAHQLNHLIRLTHSFLHVPRLLVGVRRPNEILYNWCHTVAAWLEFKDGKNLTSASRLEFLASVFAILIPIRKQLMANNPSDKTKTINRVVIMTGNPAVVQKLIFIVMGILPDDILAIDTNTAPIPSRSISISKPKKAPSESSSNGSSSSTTPSLGPSFSKGWEIPKQTPTIPTNTVTATPVNFSPSKSNSSTSLQYLSSSLSSSFNSSSWKQVPFLEKWRLSTQANNADHISHDGFMHHRKLASYRTPSPAVEYEEYPWSNATTMHSYQPNLSKLSRHQSSVDLSIWTNTKYNVKSLGRVERTTTSVKGSLSVDSMIGQECENIMKEDPKFEIVKDKDGECIIETSKFDEYNSKLSLLMKNETIDTYLRPLVGYVEEFSPEFSLQACPIKVGLDQEIINTMKSDLQDHAFCQLPEPTTVSRTIFISLAAREVKEFTLKSMGTASVTASSSPNPNLPVFNENISVRKLFSPRSRDVDESRVQRIDELLDSIIDVAKSISENDTLTSKGAVNTISEENNDCDEDRDLNNSEDNEASFSKIRELMNEMFQVC